VALPHWRSALSRHRAAPPSASSIHILRARKRLRDRSLGGIAAATKDRPPALAPIPLPLRGGVRIADAFRDPSRRERRRNRHATIPRGHQSIGGGGGRASSILCRVVGASFNRQLSRGAKNVCLRSPVADNGAPSGICRRCKGDKKTPAEDVFDLARLGGQNLKGIAGQTRAYAVIGGRIAESRFEARASGIPSNMVGRDQSWH
jgi:hypothetical protein